MKGLLFLWVIATSVATPGTVNPIRIHSANNAQKGVLVPSTATTSKRSVCGNGIVERGEKCDDGNTLDNDTCTSDCQESLTFDWRPGLPGAKGHVLPPCANADLVAAGLTSGICAMQCTASLSGAQWVCKDGTGASFTVAQGSTSTTVADPWDVPVIQVEGSTDMPSILAANATAIQNAIAAPHTVIATAFDHGNNQASLPFRTQLAGSSKGIQVRSESGQARCIYSNATATPTSITVSSTVSPANTIGVGYSMHSCRKIGSGASSTYIARTNGAQSTTTAWPGDPDTALTSADFGQGMTGQIESVTIYTTNLSDAQILAIENAYNGLSDVATRQSTDALVNGRNTPAWASSSSGQFFPVGRGTARPSASGYLVEQGSGVSGSTTGWATDNLDASSWTSVGSPTVNTNVTSGPFSSWRRAAEADRIVDADGAAFVGKQATSNCGTTVSGYTISCFLKAGDTGSVTTKARLAITTDGSGSTTCDKTLTSSFTRFTCTAQVTGSPSFVKGQVLVGNAASDTGSILVAQCQCDNRDHAMSPTVASAGWSGSAAQGDDNLTTSTNELLTWSKAGHSQQIIFNPEWNSSDIVNAATAPTAALTVVGSGLQNFVRGAFPAGTAPTMTTGSSTFSTTTAATSPTILAGHTYAFRQHWRRFGSASNAKTFHEIFFDECTGSVSACYATTLIGSDYSGTTIAPPTTWSFLRIGNQGARDHAIDANVLRVSVWSD